MTNTNNSQPRFNLIAHDRDGVLTIEVIGETFMLRRKPQEVLACSVLTQGLPPEQLVLVKYLAGDE